MGSENEWGYTNDAADFARVHKWMQDAVADGWSIEPTYGKESILSAATLRRDGWVAHALARFVDGKWNFCVKLHIWAPDELAVAPADDYDFERLVARSRSCQYCKARDVETVRMNFAGRACRKCREDEKVVAKNEPPGWYD